MNKHQQKAYNAIPEDLRKHLLTQEQLNTWCDALGESARDAALQLVHIHKREAAQRERMAARFANRPKTQPTADFDLPSANDHA